MWLWVVIAIVVVLALWFMMGRDTTSRVGWHSDGGGRPHAAALNTSQSVVGYAVDDAAIRATV